MEIKINYNHNFRKYKKALFAKTSTYLYQRSPNVFEWKHWKKIK